jgi:uncharacterized protein with FMN-binding domain
MKKLLLSIGVLGTFFLYAIYLKKNGYQNNITSASNSTANQFYSQNLPTNVSTNNNNLTKGPYKDGKFIGNVADAYYGYVQVQVNITGGKISDVIFLQYPNDRRTSIEINSQAMPYLKQEAISAQSAKVNYVSGATQTSRAFKESLSGALQQAT